MISGIYCIGACQKDATSITLRGLLEVLAEIDVRTSGFGPLGSTVSTISIRVVY